MIISDIKTVIVNAEMRNWIFVKVTAGNAALIVALSPIVTTLLARLFLRESLTVLKLAGAVIAFSGVGLIVSFSGKSFGLSVGDASLLLCMLTFSLSLLFTRRLTNSMSPYDITILTTVFGTLLMIPAAVMEGLQGHFYVSPHITFWLILAGASIFGQGLSIFWWNHGKSVIGASVSSMFMYIPPFVAIIVAFLVLGDPIQVVQLIGGGLILAGVALANRTMNVRITP